MADDFINEYVLPLANATIERGGRVKDIDASGSCWLIGRRGFALTAAHVVDQLDPNASAAMIALGGGWVMARVLASEKHPTEDVAVVKLEAQYIASRSSFFAVSGQREYASCQVELWGYPKHVTREIALELPPSDVVPVRPDLIFLQGIRAPPHPATTPNVHISRQHVL